MRFRQYKMAERHHRDLLQASRSSRSWQWVERKNPAQQHPTDFAVLRIDAADSATIRVSTYAWWRLILCCHAQKQSTARLSRLHVGHPCCSCYCRLVNAVISIQEAGGLLLGQSVHVHVTAGALIALTVLHSCL